jgi:hypothetical protein
MNGVHGLSLSWAWKTHSWPESTESVPGPWKGLTASVVRSLACAGTYLQASRCSGSYDPTHMVPGTAGSSLQRWRERQNAFSETFASSNQSTRRFNRKEHRQSCHHRENLKSRESHANLYRCVRPVCCRRLTFTTATVRPSVCVRCGCSEWWKFRTDATLLLLDATKITSTKLHCVSNHKFAARSDCKQLTTSSSSVCEHCSVGANVYGKADADSKVFS